MSKNTSILVLFSKRDNTPLKEEKMGWVDHFKIFLELFFYQLKGEKVEIMLQDGEVNIDVTSTKESINALLVIMSEHFVKSEKCLQLFDSLQETSSFKRKNQQFLIMKSRLPDTGYPPALRHLVRHDMSSVFYSQQEQHIDFFTPKAEKQYWMEMFNLVYDLQKKPTNPKKASYTTVFLAETDEELNLERQIIKQDLERHGCYVLPQTSLPTQDPELLEKTIKEDLQQSVLSIHLIGNIQKPLVNTQNKLAAMQNTGDNGEPNKKLERLMWISPSKTGVTLFKQEKQLSFIESIKRDIDVNDKIELLEGPFEDFKYLVREKIMRPQEKYSEKKSEQKKLYLAYDDSDHKAVQPYIEIIQKANFEIITDLTKGKFTKVREHHINNLCIFDATIIFQQKATNLWVQMKVLDILKSPGVGRTKPILGKAVLAPNHDINYLSNFKDQNVRLICQDEDTSIKLIKDFLSKIAP